MRMRFHMNEVSRFYEVLVSHEINSTRNAFCKSCLVYLKNAPVDSQRLVHVRYMLSILINPNLKKGVDEILDTYAILL